MAETDSGPEVLYICVLQFNATWMKLWWDVSIYCVCIFELSELSGHGLQPLTEARGAQAPLQDSTDCVPV